MIPENHYAARKPIHESRNFLFVSRTHVLVEETGEVFDRADLCHHILGYTTGTCPLICANDASTIVKDLDDKLNGVPNWVWRATPLRRVKRGSAKPPDAKPAVSVHLNPLYCGFKRENGHGKNRFFHFVDCAAVTGNTSGYHYPGFDEIESLAIFGRAYREFCRDNGVPVTGQRGKFGGAMLRDPRFIGDSERRIPQFINEKSREQLPGNHYELRTETDGTHEGIYLDITSAHHEAAKVTTFPDPSSIRARGHYNEPPTTVAGREPWARVSTPKFDAVLNTHGLVMLRALYRGTSKGSIVHPAARKATVNRPNLIWAYTNELDLLRDSGFHIQGIEAAYTSAHTSDSLNQFASYAANTLASAPEEHKPWMKSLFLSTYGMLGKRPSKYQSVSNMGDKAFTWPTPNGWIEGAIRQTSKEHSPVTTNVVALGMIQAETRRNVIELAKYLESMGVEVLALYADSLIVNAHTTHKEKVVPTQLPFLPPEWRVKTTLTSLRFLNPVSWVSDQEERLPGLARDTLLRESRRRAIGAHASTKGLKTPLWLMDLPEPAGMAERKRTLAPV